MKKNSNLKRSWSAFAFWNLGQGLRGSIDNDHDDEIHDVDDPLVVDEDTPRLLGGAEFDLCLYGTW